MPPHVPTSDSSVRCACPDPGGVRRSHRRVLALLRGFCRSTKSDLVGGSAFLAQYEQLVECVSASLEAEERLLKRMAHPGYWELSSAHRRIAADLDATGAMLRARSRLPGMAFLHSLDALVIHVTIDSAVFGPLAAEGHRPPNRPQAVTQPTRTPFRPQGGLEPASPVQERM